MISHAESRISVCFDDIVLHFQLRNVRGPQMSSFLLALAAFQRGLEVVFHRSTLDKSDRFQGKVANGLTGDAFSISDGVETHFFNRTMGDKTTRQASILAEDKNLTKEALARAGVRTPQGVVVRGGDMKIADDFMSASNSGRFVAKPLRGSLSKDTHIDISAAEVRRVIFDDPTMCSQANEWLVEEFISGSELRAYVVGDKCVSAFIRLCPTVLGNGVDTIDALTEKRNKLREQSVYLSAMPFTFQPQDILHLQRQGMSPDSVPPKGAVVQISATKVVYSGADRKNVIFNVNESFHQLAIGTCAALGLPNAGLDIIVSDDPARAGAFVLEANQRAHIASHSFPSLGEGDSNAASESILDWYFPESCGNRRFHAASFDFSQIIQTLQSCLVDEVRLPVLKADWHHCRANFSDQATGEMVWNILMSVGCYGRLLNLSSGNQVADVLLSPESQSALKRHRARIAELSPPAEAALFSFEAEPGGQRASRV